MYGMVLYGTVWYLLDTTIYYIQNTAANHIFLFLYMCMCMCMYVFGLAYYKITRYNIYSIYTQTISISMINIKA